MTSPRIATVDEARLLLEEIGAPPRLVTHGLLVAEAAEALLAKMRELGIRVDASLVRAGAVLHDAGKAVHQSELGAPGAMHEEEGQRLLLARGIDAALARCCISHARWNVLPCSLEELLVALADKLWKGVRVEELETKAIDAIVERAGRDRWSLFVDLDTCFEAIANDGPERLARSTA